MSQLFLIATPILLFLGAFITLLFSVNKKITINSFIAMTVAVLIISVIVEVINLDGVYSVLVYQELFHNTLIFDTYSNFFSLLLIGGAIVLVLIIHSTLDEFTYFKGEYFALILFSLFGMILLLHANELITAYIALEIASFSLYALIGFKKYPEQSESIVKYLVFSSFIGGFFLLGVVLVYAVVGSTNIETIAAFIEQKQFEELRLLFIAISLIFILFLFKIAAFPFQNWVLDVYRGAPTHIVSFMASIFKVAIFGFFLRLFIENSMLLDPYLDTVFYWIIVVTILYGTWLAVIQEDVKMMLVASSIVHTGYILMGFISIGQNEIAASSTLFYLIAYLLSAVVSFSVVSIVSTEQKLKLSLDNFNGLAKKRPFLSASLTIALLSLAGIPSTIGFIGKFYIFSQTIDAGYWGLTFLGVLATFVSIYYYFRVIARIYFYDVKVKVHNTHMIFSAYVILFAAFLIILGGIGSALVSFIPSANIDSLLQIVEISISSLK